MEDFQNLKNDDGMDTAIEIKLFSDEWSIDQECNWGVTALRRVTYWENPNFWLKKLKNPKFWRRRRQNF